MNYDIATRLLEMAPCDLNPTSNILQKFCVHIGFISNQMLGSIEHYKIMHIGVEHVAFVFVFECCFDKLHVGVHEG